MKAQDLKVVPPYGSVSRLKYVFDLFSTHNYPHVGASLLRNHKFSGSDAFQTIATLKFLGIIEQDGTKTEKMTKLQLKGEPHTKAILEIVKEAYLKLFETVQEPNKLNKDQLYNEFIDLYGVSGRVANTAVPNFLWLCKEAGLEVSEAPEVKERSRTNKVVPQKLSSTKKSTKPMAPTEDFSELKDPSVNEASVEVGEFKLILPDGWSSTKTRQAVAKGYFKTIYEELTRLSPLLKENTESTGDVA